MPNENNRTFDQVHVTFHWKGKMNERNLAKFFEGTSDAAFAVDLQGEIRTWNRAAEKLFGHPRESAIGRQCAEIVHGSIAGERKVCAESCDILECVRKRREVGDFDMQVKNSSGQPFWVNVSLVVAIDERTDRRLAVHLIRDISERKKADALAAKMMSVAKEMVNGNAGSSSLPPVSPLTRKESHILQLLVAGNSTKEITAELTITMETLRNHINNINKKLHTKSRIEAVAQALKRRLI